MISGSSSAFYAFMTAAPLLLIDVQSVSPEHFGRDMMLGPIGYIAAAIVSNRTVMRVGPLALIATGGVCLLAATAMLFVLPLLSAPTRHGPAAVPARRRRHGLLPSER